MQISDVFVKRLIPRITLKSERLIHVDRQRRSSFFPRDSRYVGPAALSYTRRTNLEGCAREGDDAPRKRRRSRAREEPSRRVAALTKTRFESASTRLREGLETKRDRKRKGREGGMGSEKERKRSDEIKRRRGRRTRFVSRASTRNPPSEHSFSLSFVSRRVAAKLIPIKADRYEKEGRGGEKGGGNGAIPILNSRDPSVRSADPLLNLRTGFVRVSRAELKSRAEESENGEKRERY